MKLEHWRFHWDWTLHQSGQPVPLVICKKKETPKIRGSTAGGELR